MFGYNEKIRGTSQQRDVSSPVGKISFQILGVKGLTEILSQLTHYRQIRIEFEVLRGKVLDRRFQSNPSNFYDSRKK